MDDARLRELLDVGDPSEGWGKNQVLEIGGHRVFVKRIPLTAMELDWAYSTRNLYGLPTYYNYGVGSAGFGVFRELIANIKTTHWVLSGEAAGFPLLYHYRISRAPSRGGPQKLDWLTPYVEYWGGNPSIARYMRDRADAQHEVVLFLEYVPQVLHVWLPQNLGGASEMVESLLRSVEFLRDRGVIHFDAHFHNVLTDGVQTYLTDFGLVLDRSFDLTEEERAFFDRHIDYDFGEVASCLGSGLAGWYDLLPHAMKAQVDEIIDVPDDAPGGVRKTALVRHVREIAGTRHVDLDPRYVDCLARFGETAVLMGGFYSDLRENAKKDTPFPHGRLREALRRAEVPGVGDDGG